MRRLIVVGLLCGLVTACATDELQDAASTLGGHPPRDAQSAATSDWATRQSLMEQMAGPNLQNVCRAWPWTFSCQQRRPGFMLASPTPVPRVP